MTQHDDKDASKAYRDATTVERESDNQVEYAVKQLLGSTWGRAFLTQFFYSCQYTITDPRDPFTPETIEHAYNSGVHKAARSLELLLIAYDIEGYTKYMKEYVNETTV